MSVIRLLALFTLGVIILSGRTDGLAVISIDFGSEWLKVALVKPGVPMEIVLNKESKRKTPTIVSMRNEERLFGEPAYSTSIKYPKNAYPYLQFVVGHKFDSEPVKMYRKWFPHHELVENPDTGTVLFKHNEEMYSPEELLAMIFNSSRQAAQDYAEQPIKDVIITVPPFFNMAQRRAILLAAELVGLTVHQLMNDNTAVALNYGVFRRQEFNVTPQYFMFYDMGAISTTATIVEYKLVPYTDRGFSENVPQLTVKGVGFDQTLGGLEIAIRLRSFLADRFEALKKTEGSVYDSPRAMAKLLKEAQRVKQVLSANTDHFAQIEGLLEDVDFSTKVTREDLENMCADLFDRVGKPVTDALKSADITMDEIEQVILFGGGTRVPRIQEILLKTIKRSELGKNINTDEAAALGAVYQAATMSKAFVVKKFLIKEATVYPIEGHIAVAFDHKITFERHTIDDETGLEKIKLVKKTLFQRNNPYPQKKVMTFNRLFQDFSFNVSYVAVDFLSELQEKFLGSHIITHISLKGVGDAFDKHSDKEHKGIKAHFRMDESGILHLDDVEVVFEHEVEELVEVPPEEEESTFSKISSKISSFFGGGSSEEDSTSTPPQGEATGEEQTTNESTTDQSSPESDKQDDTKPQTESEQSPDQVDEATTEAPKSDEKVVEPEQQSDGKDDSKEPEQDGPTEETKTVDDTEAEKPTKSTDEKTQQSDEAINNETKAKSGKSSGGTKAANATASSNNTKVTTKVEVVKEILEVETVKVDVTPLSTQAIVESKTKLEWLYERDEEKKHNEQAKNALESHIFEMQDFMYSEEVTVISTEEERSTIQSALAEASDWLYEEGEHAETRVYKQKLRELKRGSRSILKRIAEAKARPEAVATLKEVLNMSVFFLQQMKNFSNNSNYSKDMEQIFTDVEIKTLEKLSNETRDWFIEMETKQNASKPWEDPVMLVEDIDQKGRILQRETRYMISKLMNYASRPKGYGRYNTSTSRNNTRRNTTSSHDDISDEPTGGYDDERPTSGYNDAPSHDEGPTSTYEDAPPPPTVGDTNTEGSKPDPEQGSESTDQDTESEEVLQLDGEPSKASSEEKGNDEHQEL